MSTNGIAVAMSRPSDQPEAVPTLSEPQIAARIERLPASQWHLMIIALVGTATLFDSYDIAVIAFVMPVLVDTWKLAPNQVGLIFSAGFAGLAIGAFVFGWLAERYGRVPILIVTILLLSVGGIGCALSDGYFTLLTFRFLQGLALGGELPVAVAYVTELTKSSRRGQLIAAYQFTAPLGFMAAAYCSSWVIPHLGWQAMFYIGAIPAFLTLIVRVFVPESPRWLARHGRIEQADKVLTDIERRVLKKSGSLPPLVVAPIPAINESTAAGRFSELFSSHYMRRTLTLWIIWICASTIGYGLLAWLPTIYRTVYKMPLEEIFRFATMSGVGSLVGGVAGILLVDLIGRRLIFIVSFSLATLAMVALWYFNQSQAITPTLVVTFATLGVGATAIGQVVLWGYTSESYPTRIRAFATGTASVWGRAATLIMPIAVGFLLANSGVNAIYLVFAFMGFIGLVIVILFALETRGRRLEELSP